MALTRKLLKGMGLTEEQVDTIIEAHTDTVEGLKADIAKYKPDAEKYANAQRELDALKEAGDGGYKAKYENEKKAFADFKAGITAKEAKAAKEKAVRAYFEGKKITGSNLDLAMRGCGEEMSALEMDGEKIKDTSALDALLNGAYKGLIASEETHGTKVITPPTNNGGRMSREDIYKKDSNGKYVLSTAERQKALAESMANNE